MKEEKRGGRREGSGRKKLGLKKRMQIMITLPPEQIEWLESQETKKSKIIEDLIKNELLMKTIKEEKHVRIST